MNVLHRLYKNAVTSHDVVVKYLSAHVTSYHTGYFLSVVRDCNFNFLFFFQFLFISPVIANYIIFSRL